MDLQFGQIYGGKYRLLRLLGTGGMGAVYEGENIEQRRRVAIKTLHKELAEHHETLKRFEREAEAASRIGSEHITRVMELGQLPDGSRFMVMEFLEGVTLRQRMRERGRLSYEEAVRVVQQILAGLAAAHAAGIVHRDLKPANVFLLRGAGDRADFVKILDFGVSKLSDHKNQQMALTSTGMVVGTPHYMAPEQAKGSRDVDGRADLYATGVILYECLAGQVPFHASTFNELIFKIVLQPVPPVETFVPDIDPELATIVAKAMSKEPVTRYQSAQEFHQALSEWFARWRKAGGKSSAASPPRSTRELAALGDDDPIGDNGTVIMRRDKQLPGLPPPAAPPPPPPASAPNPQLAAPPSAPLAQAPASAPRPMQGSAPAVAQPVVTQPAVAQPAPAPSQRKLASIVAVAAFVIVFVIGGALMLLVRMARDSSDAAPAPSTSAATSAAALSPTTGPGAGAAAEGPAKSSGDAAPAPASPPSSQTASPARSTGAGSPSPGKRRTISTDL